MEDKVIGMIFVNRTKAIMVNKASPIKSVTTLKGKKVALLRRLSNLVDFNRVNEKRVIIMSLKVNGLRADDVRFVDIPVNIGSIATKATLAQTPTSDIKPKTGWKLPQEPKVETLQRGEVDAIWASGGQEVVLEQVGIVGVIYNLGQRTDLQYKACTEYPFVCATSTDFAGEYPEFVVR